MKLDLDGIEARAKSATPGPWKVETSYSDENVQAIRGGLEFREVIVDTDDCSFPPMPADAAHIAGLSPDVALELVARIRELERLLRRAEALLALDDADAYGLQPDTADKLNGLRQGILLALNGESSEVRK